MKPLMMPSNKSKRNFYTHLTERSSSQRQVLEPIDGTKSLQDVLRGRTVREFPTIIIAVPGVDEIDSRTYTIVAPSLVESEPAGSTEREANQGTSPSMKRKAEELEDEEGGVESGSESEEGEEAEAEAEAEAVVEPQQLADAVEAAKSDLAHIAAVLVQNG